MSLLAIIAGQQVLRAADTTVSWISGLTVDADGSPRAYGPPGVAALDYLANAGHYGRWWGVVVDGDGDPVVQGPSDPAPGYYISTTSYQHRQFSRFDPRRYLDSEAVPFAVIPGTIARRVPEIVLGCRVVIEHMGSGQIVEAVCGDIGPDNHVGEASIAVAKTFGLNADPKKGGEDARIFRFTFHPGVAAEGFELQALG
jgi:hypothetical protein